MLSFFPLNPFVRLSDLIFFQTCLSAFGAYQPYLLIVSCSCYCIPAGQNAFNYSRNGSTEWLIWDCRGMSLYMHSKPRWVIWSLRNRFLVLLFQQCCTPSCYQASAGLLAGTVENGTLFTLEVLVELGLGPSSMYSYTFSNSLLCLSDCF